MKWQFDMSVFFSFNSAKSWGQNIRGQKAKGVSKTAYNIVVLYSYTSPRFHETVEICDESHFFIYSYATMMAYKAHLQLTNCFLMKNDLSIPQEQHRECDVYFLPVIIAFLIIMRWKEQ